MIAPAGITLRAKVDLSIGSSYTHGRVADLNAGDELAGFIVQRVFRGGMGVVYLVDGGGQQFAVKTYRADVFDRDPTAADRFRHEAEAWVGLDHHPNVVSADHVQTVNGRPHLFLEFIEGGDLGGWIGTARLTKDVRRVIDLSVQFCDGMGHALTHGIVAHRDVKPQNCLVLRDGGLKVSDFGLARTVLGSRVDSLLQNRAGPSQAGGLTETGAAMGTFPYMAPEQWLDAKAVDHRADIYSFGVMLFEMLTGQQPFQAETAELLARMHFQAPIPELPNGDQRELRRVLERCLAKRPEYRFQNFGELRAELDRAHIKLAGRPSRRPPAATEINAYHLYNQALSYHDLGRFEQALNAVEASLAEQDDLWPAANLKAWCLRALRRPQAALEWAKSAAARSSDLCILWTTRGVLEIDLGQFEQAAKSLERALSLDRFDPAVWQASADLMTITRRYEEAIEGYTNACELRPRDEKIWNSRAIALSDFGDQHAALVAIDQALDLNPAYASAWNTKGIALRRIGEVEQATKCFEKSVKLDPTFTEAWRNCTWSLARLGRRQEAADCIAEALIANPRSADLLVHRGEFYSENGQTQEALDSYEEAIEIEPRHAMAWARKGAFWSGIGRPDKALACYEVSLESDPNKPDVLNAKGSCYEELELPDEALACFDRALFFNPRHDGAMVNRGVVFAKIGDRDQARAAFESAIRIRPDNAEACRMLGLVLLQAGQTAEAIESFDRAIAAAPSATGALMAKGDALVQMGRHSEARDCYQRAARLGAKGAVEKLASLGGTS